MERDLRVVVVDDSRLCVMQMTRIVDAIDGVEVVGSGGNGAEAVRLVGDLGPDLVLMDLVMPVMSGLEALDVIQSRFPEVRVAVVSSPAEAEKGGEAVRRGAVGALSKPFDPERVAELLHAERVALSRAAS